MKVGNSYMTDKMLDLSCISKEFNPTNGCFESVIKCNPDTLEVYIEIGDRISPEISDIHCLCISEWFNSVFLIKNTSVYPENADIDQIKDYEYVYMFTLKDNTVYYVASDLYINKNIMFYYDGWISFDGYKWKSTNEVKCIEIMR